MTARASQHPVLGIAHHDGKAAGRLGPPDGGRQFEATSQELEQPLVHFADLPAQVLEFAPHRWSPSSSSTDRGRAHPPAAAPYPNRLVRGQPLVAIIAPLPASHRSESHQARCIPRRRSAPRLAP